MVTTAAPARVVRVDAAHAQLLADFYRAVWDGNATRASVLQARAGAAQHNQADPGADIPTYLFVHDGRALGHLTTIPLQLWSAHRERAAYWLKGLMVLPEARNGPVGFMLLKTAIGELSRTLALVVEPEAIRLYTALGFVDVGVMSNYLLPLRPRVLLQRVDPSVLPLHRLPQAARGALRLARHAVPAAILGGVADATRRLWSASAGGARAASVDAIPHDADTLWRRVRVELRATPVRNAAALAARYGARAQYRILEVRDGAQLAGIAVLRRPAQSDHPRLRGVRVAVLSDMLVPPGRTDVVLGLMRAAEAHARTAGADALLCSATHAALAAPLRRLGFVRIPGNVHVLMRGVEAVEPLQEWWLFRGDSNADEVF